MQPYRITVPTKVYFGRNIWQEAIRTQETLLQGNVMIVTTGRSLCRLGYVEALRQELLQCRYTGNVILFDMISANPKLSEIREGILLGRREKADIVVGFGGGSAMDAAKAIAAGVKSEDDIEVYFYQGKEPGKGTLPIIAMPTTAGTGSELSKAASPYTRMQSETAIRIAGECLPRLASCLEDTEAREQMSFASMLMGINLGNASTCLPHRLQYPLGAHTDTSHGAGLAALFTAWIQCEYRHEPEKIEKMAELLTGQRVKGEEECVGTFYQFIKALGLPVSLSEMEIPKQQLSGMADEVSGNIGNDPASQEEGIILRLYEMAWQGKKL